MILGCCFCLFNAWIESCSLLKKTRQNCKSGCFRKVADYCSKYPIISKVVKKMVNQLKLPFIKGHQGVPGFPYIVPPYYSRVAEFLFCEARFMHQGARFLFACWELLEVLRSVLFFQMFNELHDPDNKLCSSFEDKLCVGFCILMCFGMFWVSSLLKLIGMLNSPTRQFWTTRGSANQSTVRLAPRGESAGETEETCWLSIDYLMSPYIMDNQWISIIL